MQQLITKIKLSKLLTLGVGLLGGLIQAATAQQSAVGVRVGHLNLPSTVMDLADCNGLTPCASLQDALDHIGSNMVATLLIATNTANNIVLASTTIPPTVTLWFTGDGKLTIDPGVTLKIAGPLRADPRRIFDGGGTVRFTDDGQRTSPGDGRVFYTEWFGSDPNGVEESCPAIQGTLDAAPSGAIVQLGQGVYKCSANALTLSKPLILRGTHRRESRIYWTGTTTGGVINIPFATEQAKIEKLGIRLATTGTAAYGIWAQGPRAHVQEVMIQPESASRVFGTACIRTSDTRVSNEHTYRDLDLPYCKIGIQVTNGTNILIDNVLLSSYNVGIAIGNIPSDETVNIVNVTNSLFSVKSPPSDSVGILVEKVTKLNVNNNDFDLDPCELQCDGNGHALHVKKIDPVEGGHVSFTNNRINGNGKITEPIVLDGHKSGQTFIAGNLFSRFAGTPSYVVKRFLGSDNELGEIVSYGPNTYNQVTGPVSPQLPKINVTNPDVGNGDFFTAADSAPTSWCSFSNATPGKRFSIRFTTDNTTIRFADAGGACYIYGNKHVNATMALNDVLECIYDGVVGNYAYCQIIQN